MIRAYVIRIEGCMDALRFGLLAYSDGQASRFQYDRLTGRVEIFPEETAIGEPRAHPLTADHQLAATKAVQDNWPWLKEMT